MDRTRRTFLALASAAGICAATPGWAAPPVKKPAPTAKAVAKPAPANVKPVTFIPAPAKLRKLTAVVELEGNLRLNPDGKAVTTKPIQVLGNFTFEEKPLPATGKTTQAVRHYSEATAKIRIDNGGFVNALRDDFRTMCVATTDDTATLYSPLGPLTRDELELLRIPGDPVVWNALLPTTPVKPGDTWKLSDAALATLLGIEVVTASDVSAKLVSTDAKLAILEFEGSVTGAVGGVASESELKAKYNFDHAQKQVVWLAMSVKEKRAIGHAQPGFETTARIRIAATPLATSAHLADGFLKELPLTFNDGATLLTHDSTGGGFTMLHDRRWHVMTDHSDTTILRLVDRGDLIAQCNVSRLKNTPPDKKLALDAFKEEVTQSLGMQLQQIVDVQQGTTDNGLRQLRVVAAGNVQEVPVQWTYYHLSDDAGRNIALVFTLDARLGERFAELDRSLVSSIEMRTRKEDGELAPEENPQEAPVEQAAQAETTTTKK